MTYSVTLLACLAGFGLLGIFALLTKGRYGGLVKIMAVALGISAMILHTLANAHGEYARIGDYVANFIVPRIQYIANTPIGKMVFNAILFVSHHPFMQSVLTGVIFIVLVVLSFRSSK